MEAFVSKSSTRMPFWVLICRRTMAVPMGTTSSMGSASTKGSVVKMTTTAARLLKMAGAKSMKMSFSSLTVPSRHRLSLPWILPVIFVLK